MPTPKEMALQELRQRRKQKALEELRKRRAEKQSKFDPDGDGYDEVTARKLIEKYPLTTPKPTKYVGPEVGNEDAHERWVWHEDEQDYFRHGASFDPETGLLLKGLKYPTIDKTIAGETSLGNVLQRGPDGRYYSRKKQPIEQPASPETINKIANVESLVAKANNILNESKYVASQIKTAREVGAPVEYHPKARPLLEEGTITSGKDPRRVTPAIPVEATATPKPGSKALVDYLVKRPSGPDVSPVARVDKQKRAREVYDAFDGDKKQINETLRKYAKANKKSSQWVKIQMAEIVNLAEAQAEGTKVDPSLPSQVLEGGLQTAVSFGGKDLDITADREKVGKAGQVVGKTAKFASDIAEVGVPLFSSMKVGKAIVSSAKSPIMKQVGRVLSNPNLNPVPDAFYAAVNEGDFSKNFVEGYAINVALGKLIDGKKAFQAFQDLPKAEKTLLKGKLEDAIAEAPGEGRFALEIDPRVAKELGIGQQIELFDDAVKKATPTVDDAMGTASKQDIPTTTKGDDFELLPAYERARKAVKDLNKPTLKSIRNAFTREVVDVSGNLKRELRKQGASGEKVIDRMEQALGASGKAKVRYEQALEDVYGGIKSEKQKRLLSGYIDHRRTTFLAENKKAIGDRDGLSPAETKKYFDSVKKSNPALFKQIEEAGERYFTQMNSLLDDRLEAGLISKSVHKELKGKVYSPRVWIQHLAKTEGNIAATLGEATSGLKSLQKGSDTELVHDLEFLLARSINNAERQIASNNAGKEMYDLMKTGEMGDMFVELKPLFAKGKVVDGKKVKGKLKGWTKPPRGYETVNVMIDGKNVKFAMREDMAKEFILKDPLLAPEVSKWVRILSGNNILKFNATQASTDFPLANVFRDVGTIMFANKEYSTFIPKASLQLGKDVKNVMKDAVTRKGRFLDYINEGGSMDFLMATADTWGKPSRSKLAAPLRGVADGLRWLGETSEAITRLALRERAMQNYLKQGMTQAEAQVKATIAARRYMDFGQGGRTVKALDNLMPYFNASIQGHRAWMRGAKNDPVGFTSKIMQVGGASAGLATYNIVNNPEAWDSIPDRIKTSNWVFTTPYYSVDDDGIKEYVYYTIPKPPGISAAFSVFEATAEAAQGRDVPYEQVLMGIDDFMGLGSVPPLAGAALAVIGNVDSYTWENIYKGARDIEPEAEITKTTPQWAIRAGEITGTSPERLRTAKSKFLTYRNGWWDASGATIDGLYSIMTDKEINETTAKIITPEGAPGLRRFVRKTSGEVAREKVGDAMREYHTRRKQQNMDMDKIFDEKFKDLEGKPTPAQTKEVLDYIKSQPVGDREALATRFENLWRHKDIPRHFININYMAQSSPEVKAKAIYDEWAKADEEGKKKIESYVRRIKGMPTERFIDAFNLYKSQANPN